MDPFSQNYDLSVAQCRHFLLLAEALPAPEMPDKGTCIDLPRETIRTVCLRKCSNYGLALCQSQAVSARAACYSDVATSEPPKGAEQ